MSFHVLRFLWPLFVPLGMWLAGAVLVTTLAERDKRRLWRLLLYTLPVFLFPAAYAFWIVSAWESAGPPL